MHIAQFYREVLGVTDESILELLMENSKLIVFEKGQHLIHADEVVTELYFLMEGLFRGFFLDAKGREVTDCFGVEPGTPALSCSELLTPSNITIEAMERSVVLALPGYALYPYLHSNLNLMRIYNQMLWVSLKGHWENKMAMVQYSAMERYQWFLRRYPGVIDRVPHRHVASFLGITPVSLSRIRRELREKEQVRAEKNNP